MQFQRTSQDGLMISFSVTIASKDLQVKKNDYIASRARKVRLDGFRPGKVPQNILEQHLGGDALNHALRTSVDEAIKKVATDNNLRYVNEPHIDLKEFEEGKDVVFSLSFETLPIIEIKDFKSLPTLETLDVDIDPKEVQESLEGLHKQHQSFKPEEGRSAQKGDRVACTLSLRMNGKPVKKYEKLSLTIAVGENNLPFSDVEEKVLNMKSGESKEFDSVISKDFGDKILAGKTVSVRVSVKDVLAPQSFQLDDAFAKEFGEESLDALKNKLQERLKAEYAQVARLYTKRHLLDALEKEYTFDLPKSMVTSEFETIWSQLQREIELAKEKGETIDNEGKSDDDVRAEYERIASRRVQLGLLISHIAGQQKIQLSQEELRQAIFQEAMRYPGQERRVMEYYRTHPKMIDRLAAPIMEDKVVDYILSQMTVSSVKISTKDFKEKVRGVVPTSFDDAVHDDQETAA